LGGFFALTGITGCFGGVFRMTKFLSFYMGTLLVNIILLLGAGFYSIFKAVERKNAWASLSLDSWNALEDRTKDFVQQAVR
jgi:hypothetical protein